MSSHNDHTPFDNGFPPHGGPNGNGSNGNGSGTGPEQNAPAFGASARAARSLGINADIARIQRSLSDSDEKRRFNATDYIRLLWKGKWILGACVAVSALLTAYYTYSLPFVYESSLQIAVNEGEDQPVFQQPVWYRNRDRVLKNELQFMTSGPVYNATALALIRREKLDTSVDRTSDSLVPLYAAAKVALAAKLHGANQLVQIQKLSTHMAASIERMISITPSKDADVITITTRSGDPREAALIANTYAEVYRDVSRQNNQERVRNIEGFISGRLDTTKGLLDDTEQELTAFLKQNGIAGDKLEGGDLAEQETQFKTSLSGVQIEINTIEQHLAATRKQLAEIEPTFASEMALALPDAISGLTQRLAREEAALTKLLSDNPKRGSEVWYQGLLAAKRKTVTDLRAELNRKVEQFKTSKLGSLPGASEQGAGGPTAPLMALKGRIFEDEIQLNTLRAKRAAIESALAEVRGEMATFPEKSVRLEQLDRTRGSLEEIYKELESRNIKMVIDKQAIMSNVRIISPAPVDTNPISPNRRSNMILGTILGLGLGVGIVLLIAYADTTVHSPDELSDKGFTVLAAIPAIESFGGRSLRRPSDGERIAGTLSPHLVSYSAPDSPITEAYRSLRTAIQFASIVEPIRMLLVTSSLPQEGKSTTSANLAIVMANSGLRTLLVDCDLRRPIAHANFGLPKEPGLVNALIGDVAIEEAIRPSGVQNLDVLSSGSIPPNPSELLGSRRMTDLLARLREEYDLVLIDSPPVGVVTDGVVLSTKVDATVTVVRAHRTRMEFLERTNEEISRVGGPLLGIVLNEFDASQSYGSSYKYYKYYKYYGYYGHKEGPRERRRKRATTKDGATATN
jgi:tyrosine-protein kinase Etk/Wzc